MRSECLILFGDPRYDIVEILLFSPRAFWPTPGLLARLILANHCSTVDNRQTIIVFPSIYGAHSSTFYTLFAWAGGTFSPVVLLCQFSVLAGNRFWFYILLMYLEYHTVVVLC